MLLNDLVEAGVGHVAVLLEHKLPHSPKRVDVILCGTHPRTRQPSYVLVELKQWSRAELVDYDLVHVPAYGADPVLHPVEQVRRYCSYLVDSTPALADQPHLVHGIAYLHNAGGPSIASLKQLPTGNGKRLVDDVVIGEWRRAWNAKPGRRVPDAPESYYWATDERGFHQVGCIYTAQGFEYDWAGVIFGPDFVRRDGKWVALRKHTHDPAVRKADEAHFAALIRNTYKVLLTRGMQGVCAYSTDAETQAFLEEMMG